MPVNLITLSDNESGPAALLARHRSVKIVANPEDAARLNEAGFVEAPVTVESFVRTPINVDRYSRNFRKTLRRSSDAWKQRHLHIEVFRTSEFGIDRFLERIYYPLFARAMYDRGIAPHNANRLLELLVLLESETRLAVVFAPKGGAQADAIVGAALLRAKGSDHARHAIFGELPEGDWEEGLIYALAPGLGECRRALMVELSKTLAAEGRQWFSLGRDAAWCEAGYDGVLLGKLRLADSLVAGLSAKHHLFRFHLRVDDSLLLFEWNRRQRQTRPTLLGAATANMVKAMDRLSDVLESNDAGSPVPSATSATYTADVSPHV